VSAVLGTVCLYFLPPFPFSSFHHYLWCSPTTLDYRCSTNQCLLPFLLLRSVFSATTTFNSSVQLWCCGTLLRTGFASPHSSSPLLTAPIHGYLSRLFCVPYNPILPLSFRRLPLLSPLISTCLVLCIISVGDLVLSSVSRECDAEGSLENVPCKQKKS
jgi:hypothetical protein